MFWLISWYSFSNCLFRSVMSLNNEVNSIYVRNTQCTNLISAVVPLSVSKRFIAPGRGSVFKGELLQPPSL